MQIKRNKTYLPKEAEIKRNWYIVDASGKILGRLAARIARILMGKNKPTFTPHLDTGDGVVVVNAAFVRVTGRKRQEKIYQRFSGYPSGQKRVPFDKMMDKKPQLIIMQAVKNMLPDNKLRTLMLRRLKVYKDEAHPHSGLNLVKLEV